MGLSITLSMLFSDEASMVPAIIRWITAGFSFIAMCAVLVVLFFFTRHFKKQLDLMKNRKFTWKYGVLTKEPYGVLRNNNGIVLKIDDINCIYRENAHTLVGVKEDAPFLMIAFEKAMYALNVCTKGIITSRAAAEMRQLFFAKNSIGRNADAA